MRKYTIFFSNDKENLTLRLPVNPEVLQVNIQQEVRKFEVLKQGQVAVPTFMQLREFEFDTELPNSSLHYIEKPDDFTAADTFLETIQKWRESLEPIRFIAGYCDEKNKFSGNAINTLVFIHSLLLSEKAGEESDKYASFKLIEYNPYSVNKKKVDEVKPSSTGFYIVKKGDCLWNIARKYYNDGTKFTKIYNANKSIIKNPKLIYPGQKLVIPK